MPTFEELLDASRRESSSSSEIIDMEGLDVIRAQSDARESFEVWSRSDKDGDTLLAVIGPKVVDWSGFVAIEFDHAK